MQEYRSGQCRLEYTSKKSVYIKCFTRFNEIKHCEIYWPLVANQGDAYDNRKKPTRLAILIIYIRVKEMLNGTASIASKNILTIVETLRCCIPDRLLLYNPKEARR